MGPWEFPYYFLSCGFLVFSSLTFCQVLLRGSQNPPLNPIFHLVWHSTKLSHLHRSLPQDRSGTALLSVWHYLQHLLFLLFLNNCKKLQTNRDFSLGGKLLNMNAVNTGPLNPSSLFYLPLPPYLKARERLPVSSVSRLFGRSSLSLVSATSHESQRSVK